MTLRSRQKARSANSARCYVRGGKAMSYGASNIGPSRAGKSFEVFVEGRV